MTTSNFDERLFGLGCGHPVVLGRLDKVETWTCEHCGQVTDLRQSPFRETLEKDLDTADQIDKQARQRGETVVRETRGGV